MASFILSGEDFGMKHLAWELIILTLAFESASNAQLLRSYGVKAALTSSDQKFDYRFATGPGSTRRIGFNIAAYAEWFDVPFLSLVTQIEYAQRGTGQDFVVTNQDPVPLGVETVYSRLDYLSIPILGKLRFQSENFVPYVVAGPRVDYLLGYQSDEFHSALYDGFQKATIGGSVGIGLQMDTMLPVGISAEVRYNFDLVDSYSTDLLKVRNNAYDIWLGVAF